MDNIQLPLTKLQKQTLDYVIAYFRKYKYPPVTSEIQRAVKIRNSGMVHKVLRALERKNYIVKKKGEHRSIRLKKLN